MPINSFDERMSPVVQPQSPGIKFSIENSIYFTEVLQSMESLSILRNLQAKKNKSVTFSDHTAEIFMRFRAEELKTLKKCQLQVLLYNEGQLRAFADNELMNGGSEYHIKEVFSGQESNTVTWHPSHFDKGLWKIPQLNLVNTGKTFTSDMLQQFLDFEYAPGRHFGQDKNLNKGDYMSWGFMVNFVNNFNFTVQEPECAGFPEFDLNFVPRLPPFRLTGDTLTVPGEYTWLFPPFLIVIRGQGMWERMLVTSIRTLKGSEAWNKTGTQTCQVLTVTRTRDSYERSALYADLKALAVPPVPGNTTWVCPFEWYANGVCNCECGGLDVDCLSQNIAETGCESKDSYGTICSLEGRCASANYTYDLTVSEGCPVGKMLMPGTDICVCMCDACVSVCMSFYVCGCWCLVRLCAFLYVFVCVCVCMCIACLCMYMLMSWL